MTLNFGVIRNLVSTSTRATCIDCMHIRTIFAVDRVSIILDSSPIAIPRICFATIGAAKVSIMIGSAGPAIFIMPGFVWVSGPLFVVAMAIWVILWIPTKVIIVIIVNIVVAAANSCIKTLVIGVMSESPLP